MHRLFLRDFTPHHASPAFAQEEVQRLLVRAFATAECVHQGTRTQDSANQVLSAVEERVKTFAVRPEFIRSRRMRAATNDDGHLDLSRLFPRITEAPRGTTTEERMADYRAVVGDVFDELYARTVIPPDDLVHVSCSGYRSPSPAQELVARRGWIGTRVTHSYHMGCYGAFPAVRMAAGFLSADLYGRPPAHRRVDVAHTEYLSLHLQVLDLTPGDVIDMTLFGDGFIRYSLFDEPDGPRAPGLELLAMRDEVIPGTAELMSWDLGQHGFEMYLDKKVPEAIRRASTGFCQKLLAQAGFDWATDRPRLLFAIHPGGPKILDFLREELVLTREQTRLSWEVLAENGNMSSATVPYLWKRILESPDIPAGTLIVSLGFGPGLTACGNLLRKTGA